MFIKGQSNMVFLDKTGRFRNMDLRFYYWVMQHLHFFHRSPFFPITGTSSPTDADRQTKWRSVCTLYSLTAAAPSLSTVNAVCVNFFYQIGYTWCTFPTFLCHVFNELDRLWSKPGLMIIGNIPRWWSLSHQRALFFSEH